MSFIQLLKTEIYQNQKFELPLERRKFLIKEMAKLEAVSVNCFNCLGTCCTFSANSMQITPIEALEIVFSLDLDSESLKELKKNLESTIKNYRLDHEISTGKKIYRTIRRTYTCPFFSPGPKGCTLGRSHKPYGCLGFNPKITNDNGSNCRSNVDLLEKRETTYCSEEKRINLFLQKTYSLCWDKLDLPSAILGILTLNEFSILI